MEVKRTPTQKWVGAIFVSYFVSYHEYYIS